MVDFVRSAATEKLVRPLGVELNRFAAAHATEGQRSIR